MGVLDQLGQTVLPQIFESLQTAGLVDLMNVTGETVTVGSGGGRVKSAASEVYGDIPVSYKPLQVENRLTAGDKLLSIQQYMLTFPVTDSFGFRYDIDSKAHKLVVLERGNEPEKVFRIVALREKSGVVYEAICTKEN